MPLDYADPQGPTIGLSLVRKPATSSRGRLGSIVVNPGGPGGSGVDYVRGGGVVDPSVAARYDVVGFDPRGVQRSAPVRCLTAKQTDEFLAYDGSPDNDIEATGAYLLGRSFGAKCELKAAQELPFLGTRETTFDMEVLRQVLGDDALNFVGKSYGTYLGSQYASRFPDKVGRFVLDGAIDPSLTAEQYAKGQAVGFQRALDAFIRDCVARSSCPLGRDPERATERLNAYLDRLDSRPQQVGTRNLTQSLAVMGVIGSLYSTSTWPLLRDALSLGIEGDGSGLLQIADSYSDRDADGSYSSNATDAFYATYCLDRPDTKGVDAMRALGLEFRAKVSRTFGEYIAWGQTPCPSWPVKATTRPAKVTAAGASPILVVGTTRDPATPWEWSKALAGQLDSGVLLTREGDGHTAYREGNGCIDQAVDTYLLMGRAPKSGTVCTP